MNYYILGFILVIIAWMVFKQVTDKDRDYSIPILISSLFGIGTIVHKIFSSKEETGKNEGKLEYLEEEEEEIDDRIEEIEKEIEKKEKEIENIKKEKEGTARDIVEKDREVAKLEKEREKLIKKNDEKIKELSKDVEGKEFEDDSDVVDYINDNFSD